jgi:hypothetical protein
LNGLIINFFNKEKKMTDLQVSAKDPKSGKAATISVKTGDTATEMIKMFGEEAVASNANSNWVVTLQSAIRSGIRRGETQEQIQKRLGEAKMGVKVVGGKVDPVQAFVAKFQASSAEEQQKMLAELKSKAAK